MVATQLSIEDFERAVEDGSFHREWGDRRIELLFGELAEMSPIGPQHSLRVQFLDGWSWSHVPTKQASIRIQSPIRIPKFDSEPEPDVVWVKRGNYGKRHPSPPDVLLIIEVADKSLMNDQREKGRLYALAGIADYWLVNIPKSVVEVHREPRRGRYTEIRRCGMEETIRPLAVPRIKLSVKELFSYAG